MLAILAAGVVTIFLLTGGGSFMTSPHTSTSTRPTPAATSPASTSAVLPANTQTYPIHPDNIGLMQPAVDAQGNIWFGEMAANRLGRLDPRTSQVTAWQPPNGRYNIMAATVDAQGRVWFTEQAGNYIGRFDPVAQTFTTYPLDSNGGHGTAPQDLRFDRAGYLWFTEITGGKIGRLDPTTGAIQTWSVPAPSTATPAYPYSLTPLPDGQIWFGLLSGGAVGHLDPTTGHITLYHLADSGAQVFSMAADGQGRVWFTELETGKLGMMDTRTNTLVERSVPNVAGDPKGLYAIVVGPSGDVWFGSAGSNALVRYTASSQTFTFYTLSIPQSIPFGLAFDAGGRLWFTADASPTNYIGVLRP
jgi:virginiamycin B lyase